MAIGDDFTIDYVNQRIYHEPAGTDVYTLNQLYTYFTLTFDDDLQMDDLPPMSAQTPTAFTMENGWFIDEVSLQFLNGGSLTTIGWNHSAPYPNGIRVLTFASDAGAVPTDIKKPVAYASAPPGDTGVLLYYNTAGTKWWVRANSVTDTFADFSEAVAVTGGTGTGTMTGAAATGENTWANVFTLGTIAANTQIYLYQNAARINSWWTDGHIDVLVLVKEAGTLIDYGSVTIFVRQYTKLYDHYTADLSAGARTPIPLATFDDSNNLTGFRTVTAQADSGAGTFTANNYAYVGTNWAEATVKAVITAVGGTSTNPILTYYLIGDLTDFANGNTIQEYVPATASDGDASCTSGVPAAAGPAALVPAPTITFASLGTPIYNEDINDGSGDQPYEVVIDCNQNYLADVYQYLKYVTRYGETVTQINGHAGEMYTSVGDIRLNFNTEVGGPFQVGETVTATGGISGVIVSLIDNVDDTGTMVLRDVKGSIVNSTDLTGGTSNATCNVVGTPSTIAPSKQAPFGSFAGGKFFGARGVWLTDYKITEANNFQLIDSNNVARIPPPSITLAVAGILADDQVAVFRATGDNDIVDKSMFTIDATTPAGAGVTSVRVNEVIPNDTPTSGYIRLVHRTAGGVIETEEKIAYSAWSNASQASGYSIFTTSAFNSTLDSTDTAYVPYIDATSIGTSVTVGLVYVSPRYITCRVRKSGILPFMQKNIITSSNLTITASRATDSIAPLGV